MTAKNPQAIYACINQGEASCPKELESQDICINGGEKNVIPVDKLAEFFGKFV